MHHVQGSTRPVLIATLAVLGVLAVILQPGSLAGFGFLFGLTALVVGTGVVAFRAPVRRPRMPARTAGSAIWHTGSGSDSFDAGSCDSGAGDGGCDGS